LIALVGGSPLEAAGAATPAAAVPGSFAAGYGTPVLAAQVGGILPFVNTDLQPHNICIKTPDGSSTLGCGSVIPMGGVSTDTPTDFLTAGVTYPFYCFLHPQTMKGTLVALPGV
jgi:plastocyanin